MSEAIRSATATVVRDAVAQLDQVIPTPRGSLTESIDDTSTERREGAPYLGMSYPGLRYAMERLGLRSH